MAIEHRKDKLLSRSIRFLFLLVFLFSIAIAPAAFAENGVLSGDGSSENPYLIDDEADLIAFREIVNGGHSSISPNQSAHAKLTKDITLEDNWTPIGDAITYYTGTFDGGGYTINGLYVNVSSNFVGFFGYVDTGGVVKNLTIGSGTVSGDRYVGGIVGNNYGAVLNCTNSAAVSGDSYVGGIVGGNYGTVENCTNSGGVSGTDGFGGIAGESLSIVKNCAWLEGTANYGVGNDSDHTGVTKIYEYDMSNIVTSLSASIDTHSVYTDETATITFSTSPASPDDVFDSTAGALRSGGVTIEYGDSTVAYAVYNGDGTITVTGLSEGETTITVKAMFYATDFSTLSNSTPSYLTTGTELTFTFNLTVLLTEQDEDGSTATGSTTKSGGSDGGCNAGTGALALLALIPLVLRRKR